MKKKRKKKQQRRWIIHKKFSIDVVMILISNLFSIYSISLWPGVGIQYLNRFLRNGNNNKIRFWKRGSENKLRLKISWGRRRKWRHRKERMMHLLLSPNGRNTYTHQTVLGYTICWINLAWLSFILLYFHSSSLANAKYITEVSTGAGQKAM